MKFRRDLIGTLAIQGVGAAAVFGAVILIGLLSGPTAQGHFSRVKSEIEFIVAISMFGMPQAVFYFLNSQRMSLVTAVKVSGILGIVSVAISSIYIGVTHSVDSLYMLLFAAASAAMVVHGMLRIVILVFSSTHFFNIVTTLPQVLLFILVVTINHGNALVGWVVPVIFFISYFIGCAFVWSILRVTNISENSVGAQGATLKELLKFGAAAWLVAALSTATAVFWLRHTEAALGQAAVGVFAMGLTIVQVVLTPFNYAAPLLYKRWMEAPDNSQAIRLAIILGIGSFLVISMLLLIQGQLPMLESVSAYSALIELKWAFAVAAAAEVMIRIVAVSTTSAGYPLAPALAESVRLALLGIAVGLGFANNLTAITIIWTLASVMACVTLLVAAKRKNKSRAQIT